MEDSSEKDVFLSPDPADWEIINDLIDHIAVNGIPQNPEKDFAPSARTYNDQTRYMSESFFYRKMKNGEVSHRA